MSTAKMTLKAKREPQKVQDSNILSLLLILQSPVGNALDISTKVKNDWRSSYFLGSISAALSVLAEKRQLDA